MFFLVVFFHDYKITGLRTFSVRAQHSRWKADATKDPIGTLRQMVTETLVDMGARRDAIQVTGVGKSDLAVPTGNGVREAKNRRSVVTLLP